MTNEVHPPVDITTNNVKPRRKESMYTLQGEQYTKTCRGRNLQTFQRYHEVLACDIEPPEDNRVRNPVEGRKENPPEDLCQSQRE